MRTVSTTAFVLRSIDVAEYDRAYLLFTEAWGKVWVRAPQVRRTKRLLAGHLQPLLAVQVQLRERGNQVTLQEAVSGARYGQVGLEQLARLEIVGELADRFSPLAQPDRGVTQVLQYVSTILTQDAWGPLVFVEVIAKMVTAVGIAPQVNRCVVSDEALQVDDELYWSSQHGGVVRTTDHPQLSDDQSLRPLSVSACKLLRVLLSDELVAGRVTADPVVVREVETVLLQYVQTSLQRALKELPFLVVH